MNYLDALKSVYPNLLDSQIELRDDGAGVYISKWTNAAPEPVLSDFNPLAVKTSDKFEKTNSIHSLLKQLEDTNWYVLRKIELGTEIPSDVATFRSNIYTQLAALQAELDTIKLDIKNTSDDLKTKK